MTRTTCAAGALLLVMGCGASSQANVASGSSDIGSAQLSQLQIGGCREEALSGEAKRVHALSAGWTLDVPNEARAVCDDYKVQVELGPGANVVITSAAFQEPGHSVEDFAKYLLDAAVQPVFELDAKAKVSGLEPGTFGEQKRPGLCKHVDYMVQGTAMRALLCAAWSGAKAADLVMLMAVNDTPQGFSEAGPDQELMSGIVDLWRTQ